MTASSKRRRTAVPRRRLLECPADAQRRRFAVAAAGDLQRGRQAAGGEAVRQRKGAPVDEVDGARVDRGRAFLVDVLYPRRRRRRSGGEEGFDIGEGCIPLALQ